MTTEKTEQIPTETQSPIQTDDRLAAAAQANQGDNVRASWNMSLDAITANTAYMRPEARELLRWCFLWCIDPKHPYRMEEFADRIGYSKNKVYKIYSGKDRHPKEMNARGDARALMDLTDDMVKALRDFKRIEVTRSSLGVEKVVVTDTLKRIYKACHLARESQTPVFVEGASHIGKTYGFRQYCVENNHGKSVLIELEGVNGLHGLVRAVAKVLGISDRGNAADLIERIKRGITSDMVLVFDEIHLLANTYRRGSFFACMEFIRRLYDFTQCGIVLSFTTLGFAVAEKERKRELEQIFRRGVHRINLGDMPTKSDVKTILKAWGLEFPARRETLTVTLGNQPFTETPFDMLQQLAREQGLKAITERLRYATKVAAEAEETLAWEHVVTAHLAIQRNAEAPAHGWAA